MSIPSPSRWGAHSLVCAQMWLAWARTKSIKQQCSGTQRFCLFLFMFLLCLHSCLFICYIIYVSTLSTFLSLYPLYYSCNLLRRHYCLFSLYYSCIYSVYIIVTLLSLFVILFMYPLHLHSYVFTPVFILVSLPTMMFKYILPCIPVSCHCMYSCLSCCGTRAINQCLARINSFITCPGGHHTSPIHCNVNSVYA